MPARSRPEPTRFDPFLHDVGLRQTYHLLFKGAWDELDASLTVEPAGWLASSILVSDDAAIETTVFQRFVDGKGSARSLALLGGAQVRDCMAALGSAVGVAGLPVEQRTLASQQFLAAERTLHEAIRLDPTLSDPWLHLLTSGRGLNVDLQELRDRFENAHRRAPFRPDACRAYLFGLSSRGGGVDGAMFDFARWLANELSPGHPAVAGLAIAHLEHGLGAESSLTQTAHLAQPETVAELAPVLADFIWDTPTVADPDELMALNAFALALTITDRETAELVRECFHRIDNRPTSYPWSLYENEHVPAVFSEVQRAQLRAADRLAP